MIIKHDFKKIPSVEIFTPPNGEAGHSPILFVDLEIGLHSETFEKAVYMSWAELQQISETDFHRFQPQIVVAPLTSPNSDAVDVAARLFALGFDGVFKIVSPKLPNPAIVLADVALISPDLDTRLMMI